MNKLILFILLVTNLSFGQIVFYNTNPEHDSLVYASFIEGYGSEFNRTEYNLSNLSIPNLIDTCNKLNVKLLVLPVAGAYTFYSYVIDYSVTVNFGVITPAGSNTYTQCFPIAIPDYMILCGATDTATKTHNVTGYNITFHTVCIQQLSSYACGKIAGIIARVMDYGFTFSQAKALLTRNRAYTNNNGYGMPIFRNSKILMK